MYNEISLNVNKNQVCITKIFNMAFCHESKRSKSHIPATKERQLVLEK